MNKTINKNTAVLIAKWSCALMFIGAFFTRCATIMTPTGGPKDTIPPMIVHLNPDNFTTNFKDKKVYIEFNEFVQIKDQQKHLFTSPAMKKMPLVSIKGKGIVITIRDTLRDNTTYAIDFGNAICDNNEGNPLNGMRYVLSTGNEIDSMVCTGYTADSFRADSVSRSFIWFFAADSLPDTPGYDSTIFNRKPDVIARSQNNGIFIAQNLKPIPYRIYAIGDKNDNMMYDPGTDLVGIVDSAYNPAKMPPFAMWFDSLRMYTTAEPQLYFRMFTDVPFKNQRLVEHSRPGCKQLLLYFNTANPQIEEFVLDSIPSSKIFMDPITRGKDTVNVWIDMPAEALPDTIKGTITYFKHDSIRQLVQTTENIKAFWKHFETDEEEKERKKEEREKAKAEAEGREYEAPKKPNPFSLTHTFQGELNPEKAGEFKLNFPLVAMDSTKMVLTMMGTDEKPESIEQKMHFRMDTMSMCHWEVHSQWKEGMKYRLYLPKGALTDIMGYQNDSTVIDFKTMSQDKYASLVLHVRGEAGKKYIIQQTDNSGKVQKEIKDAVTGNYRINYIPAGEIKLRIIEDKNGNGRWDAGSVVNMLQPERSELYMNDKGEETFTTKVNWEIELDLDMASIFKPMDMKTLQKLLDDKESARLKKLYEDLLKKRAERPKNENRGGSGGMMGSSGGMGGMMGGMGGMMGGAGGRLGGSMMR